MTAARYIRENLARQAQGLKLLHSLLQEEFSLLRQGRSQDVSQLELSIQELMRQFMVERLSLRRLVQEMEPGASRVSQILDLVQEEDRQAARACIRAMDGLEQKCALQAEQNRILVLALYDQSRSMLSFLHDQVMPKRESTYGSRGRMAQHSPQPMLLSGRS